MKSWWKVESVIFQPFRIEFGVTLTEKEKKNIYSDYPDYLNGEVEPYTSEEYGIKICIRGDMGDASNIILCPLERKLLRLRWGQVFDDPQCANNISHAPCKECPSQDGWAVKTILYFPDFRFFFYVPFLWGHRDFISPIPDFLYGITAELKYRFKEKITNEESIVSQITKKG